MAVTRIPPNNEEAEQAVLGALLIDRDAINSIIQLLKPDFFYNDNNKDIFQAMLDLYEERKPIDLLTLTHILKKKKKYEQVGGSTYITSLANAVPTAANIEHYAQILKETYIRISLAFPRKTLNRDFCILEKPWLKALTNLTSSIRNNRITEELKQALLILTCFFQDFRIQT